MTEPEVNEGDWQGLERDSLSRRAFLGAATGSLAALLAACTGARRVLHHAAGEAGHPSLAVPHQSPPAPLTQAVPALPKDVPHEVLLRLWRGYRTDRGGELITIPKGFNFFDGGISHTTPWSYTQDVPVVWYGPGVIRPQGKVKRPVTSADIAPTMARLVDFGEFQAPDGKDMEEVTVRGSSPPALVVVLVWDAAGNYVLDDLWPHQWPNLRALLRKSTWYSRATAGSSPSSTAPIHATIGTGAFPRRHGILDNYIRFPDDGELADPWSRGPRGLLSPTLADQYAEANRGKAITGLVASLSWHLGMLGHGSEHDPKTRPVAVLREKGSDAGAEGVTWGFGKRFSPYYRFPTYVNDLPPLSAYFAEADLADGVKDGLWRGHDIAGMLGGFHTPARIPYQNRVIEEVIRREGFGHHDRTDLMFLNYKLIDEIGHEFTSSAPEMGDAIRIQDAYLPKFISFLNRQVGKGRWAMVVTADHGHSASTDVTGAFRIKVDSVDAALESQFDTARHGPPLVQKVRPGWTFVDTSRARAEHATMQKMSAFFAELTKQQSTPDQTVFAASQADDPVLAASFPGALLSGPAPSSR